MVETLEYDKDICFSYYLIIKTCRRINGIPLTVSKFCHIFCVLAVKSNLGVKTAALSVSLEKVLSTDHIKSPMHWSKMSVRSVTSSTPLLAEL